MTMYHFQVLEREQQLDLLQMHGVYVGKRAVDEMTVILYQLESFYIEIYYRKYRTSIQYLKYSSSTRILHPYLLQIDVKEVVDID